MRCDSGLHQGSDQQDIRSKPKVELFLPCGGVEVKGRGVEVTGDYWNQLEIMLETSGQLRTKEGLRTERGNLELF